MQIAIDAERLAQVKALAHGANASDLTVCTDCRFYKLGLIDRLLSLPGNARCQHEMAGFTDPVTGRRHQKFCSSMRVLICGERAKLYEPRVVEP